MASRFPFEPFDPDREPDPVVEDPLHRLAFRSAVAGADAYRATRGALTLHEGTLRVGNRFVPLKRYREVAFAAIGRAAVSQALAVVQSLGPSVHQGFIVSPEPLPTEVPFRWLELPSGGPGHLASETAAPAVEELAGGLEPRDLLLVLLSPGALGYLARAPEGLGSVAWQGWLTRLGNAGASGAEIDRAARLAGSGAVGGRLADATSAEVATLIVDRGRGAAIIGGGPTVPVRDAERVEMRAVLERIGEWARMSPAERGPFQPGSTAHGTSDRVHRPVVVSEPADALREASGAVGDKHWIPRLADLTNDLAPEAAADRFLARTEELWTDFVAAPPLPDAKGLVTFAPLTLGLPEGVDERGSLETFLRRISVSLRRRDMTVAAWSTAGAPAPGAPPGGVIGSTRAGGPTAARALRMRSGVTDVGCFATAVLPAAPR